MPLTATPTHIAWDPTLLDKAIQHFPQVTPITSDMQITFSGISRLVMLDRYAFKDTAKTTLRVGDLVILTVKEDPTYPARGIGVVQSLDTHQATVYIDEDFIGALSDPTEKATRLVTRPLSAIDKPLEVYYEQIAHRVAGGLAQVEESKEAQAQAKQAFYDVLIHKDFVPAGRVLYGAGSKTNVTYFNCYVMPFIPDSRAGIADYRKQVMEIMSRGGGVGTNGSTLRPHHTLARGVNGRSSGSVSWLNDIASLTHLVEQGGSRRGAQMIMLADWHPDILEFIIAKMQNPRVLKFLIENTTDPQIKQLAEDKLDFTPLTANERTLYEYICQEKREAISPALLKDAKEKLQSGGRWSVKQPDYLSGANISVTLTDDFMTAVKNNAMWTLRFPDIEHYSKEEMAVYDEEWAKVGDVREWEKMGHAVKDYCTIPARELWQLINICATYAAEPGIFFIDNANKMTNAVAYGQKVVATNPCGEQPLAPYSVCNLGAINLANMVDPHTHTLDRRRLIKTVKTAIRLQDNVIDATPYFLPENKAQALGERRIGLGVMGLADLLIHLHLRYGSPAGNQLLDDLFKLIATTAYETSIELAKTRGSFPFLCGKTPKQTQTLRQRFIQSGYMQRMPESIRRDILKYGIRNSHLLTVAPTGSTGTMIGVATGLEPYFAFKYFRSGRLGQFIEVNADIVNDYLASHPDQDDQHLPDYFVSAMALTPKEHVSVQTTIQRWVDSSISKTVNAPSDYGVRQVAEIYEALYQGGAKGGTVYVDGSRDTQVLTLDNHTETETKTDPLSDDFSSVTPSRRNKATTHDQENEVIYGSEVGNTCPICRQGIVEERGGCNTCTNCGAQLRCGL
ncbi:MAG: vitamin B12-dependent ribonucleotide reductase [Aerococcus sp.]|nr:vitamin B12-dependent ribonucleotide reductase [Aerococcus sp.]